MSALFVILETELSGRDPSMTMIERMITRLKHRGPDGIDYVHSERIAMGHCHFWTTPQEINEKQPLKISNLPFTLIFDGRVDNRTDLIREIGLDINEARHLSDASLILHAYDRWQSGCLKHILGEFAFALWDEWRKELLVARDALGRCTLFYGWQGSSLLIASEPWAVAGAFKEFPGVSESAAAHYFSLKVDQDGQSFFKNIFELQPAHFLKVTPSGSSIHRYWQPDLSKKIRYRSDTEYSEHFLSLLNESLLCRMRASTPVSVLLSGGLDSTPLASLAARNIFPEKLTTISYVFDRFPECDERSYINELIRSYDINSLQIPCDDLYPLNDFPSWPVNPNLPIMNFYLPIRNRAFQVAHEQGSRVLLTGDFGDHIYAGGNDWLADLLFDGRILDAVKSIGYHLNNPFSDTRLRSVYFRRIARKIINSLGFTYRRKPTSLNREWLTSDSRNLVPLRSGMNSAINDRYESLFGDWVRQESGKDSFLTASHDIELRFPYRDRRLVEFMLAIPAYQIYQDSSPRYVLRNAMEGILPEEIRLRRGKTSFINMLAYGINESINPLREFFGLQDSPWNKYVKQQWIKENWNELFLSKKDGADQVIPWLCIAYNKWYNLVNQ